MSRVTAPPKPQVAVPQATVKVPHDKIAMRAYEKWLKRGRPHGSHEQDWIEAEKELLMECVKTTTSPGRR